MLGSIFDMPLFQQVNTPNILHETQVTYAPSLTITRVQSMNSSLFSEKYGMVACAKS